MSRRPVLAAVTALLLLAPASSARANPAITVDSAMLPGSTASLPLTARHVLTLTAGAAPERLTVSVNPTVKLTVVNATVERPTAATGPSLTTCPGRWNRIRRHHVFRTANPHEAEATFTIAAGQTATVTADVTIVRTPFDDDTPDAEWSIEPAQGGPFTIVSAAPRGLRGAAGGLRALLGRRARVRQQRLDLRDVAARPLETVADAWTIDGRRSVWPRARTRGCRTPLHSR